MGKRRPSSPCTWELSRESCQETHWAGDTGRYTLERRSLHIAFSQRVARVSGSHSLTAGCIV